MTRKEQRLARAIGCVVVGASVALAPMPRAFALECPAPQPLNRPGILNETPAQMRQVEDLLATGDDDNRIHVVVNDLRTRHPGVDEAEIINYLMAAYCRVVAQLSGLGDQQKRARMSYFLTRVSQIVY